jgi:hypothetical protein
VILILSIINYISIEQDHRAINTLNEQQEFLDDILYETVKNQSSIQRTQRTILEMIDVLIEKRENEILWPLSL